MKAEVERGGQGAGVGGGSIRRGEASVGGKRLSAEAMTGGSGRGVEKLSMVRRRGGGYGRQRGGGKCGTWREEVSEGGAGRGGESQEAPVIR